MESEEIKITSMIKLHAFDKSKNFFKIKNSFNAEEIFFVAKQLRGLHAKQMITPSFHSFSDNCYYRISNFFVTRDPNLLSTDNIYSILTSEQGNNSLKTFLASKNLNSLQAIYGDFLENSGRRRTKYYDTKEKLIDLLIADPMKLISPTVIPTISEFLQNYLVSFDKLRYENTYIEASSAFGIKEPIVFNFMELKGLTPQAKPRFFKLTYNEKQYLPGMRTLARNFQNFQKFFKETKSIATETDRILDMEDTKALETLKKFIPSHSNEEFLLEPIGYEIKRDDLQKRFYLSEEERKKFKVRWPNNLADLTELFGQRVKSKFLTLKNGLELLERLEPSQKFIELMQGKKVLLDLYTYGHFRNIMGTPLESKLLEVLILHLKLESIQQDNLMICKVQEKITEETLAYIWQKVESGPTRYNARFTGYQLTE